MKKIAIKNYLLLSKDGNIGKGQESYLGLIDWVDAQNLHGKESRVRTKLLKQLLEKGSEIETVRMELLAECSEKNEKGETLYIGNDGKDTTNQKESKNFKLSKEGMDKFNEKFNEFLQEDYIIDILPSTSEMITVIKDLLLNTKDSFSGKGAYFYDEWCRAFESPIVVDEEIKGQKSNTSPLLKVKK